MFSAKVTQTKPKIYEQIKKNLRDLASKKVVAGFPKGKLNAPHYENGESIIDVAISNNYGLGVPRRDFMTKSTERWNEECQKEVQAMGEELTLGKINAIAFLKKLGMKGKKIITNEIIKLHTPPNSPLTIAMKGSSNPLVDSGDMAKSTQYEIREASE